MLADGDDLRFRMLKAVHVKIREWSILPRPPSRLSAPQISSQIPRHSARVRVTRYHHQLLTSIVVSAAARLSDVAVTRMCPGLPAWDRTINSAMPLNAFR
jgi:hypothetical protein